MCYNIHIKDAAVCGAVIRSIIKISVFSAAECGVCGRY